MTKIKNTLQFYKVKTKYRAPLEKGETGEYEERKKVLVIEGDGFTEAEILAGLILDREAVKDIVVDSIAPFKIPRRMMLNNYDLTGDFFWLITFKVKECDKVSGVELASYKDKAIVKSDTLEKAVEYFAQHSIYKSAKDSGQEIEILSLVRQDIDIIEEFEVIKASGIGTSYFTLKAMADKIDQSAVHEANTDTSAAVEGVLEELI